MKKQKADTVYTHGRDMCILQKITYVLLALLTGKTYGYRLFTPDWYNTVIIDYSTYSFEQEFSEEVDYVLRSNEPEKCYMLDYYMVYNNVGLWIANYPYCFGIARYGELIDISRDFPQKRKRFYFKGCNTDSISGQEKVPTAQQRYMLYKFIVDNHHKFTKQLSSPKEIGNLVCY